MGTSILVFSPHHIWGRVSLRPPRMAVIEKNSSKKAAAVCFAFLNDDTTNRYADSDTWRMYEHQEHRHRPVN